METWLTNDYGTCRGSSGICPSAVVGTRNTPTFWVGVTDAKSTARPSGGHIAIPKRVVAIFMTVSRQVALQKKIEAALTDRCVGVLERKMRSTLSVTGRLVPCTFIVVRVIVESALSRSVTGRSLGQGVTFFRCYSHRATTENKGASAAGPPPVPLLDIDMDIPHSPHRTERTRASPDRLCEPVPALTRRDLAAAARNFTPVQQQPHPTPFPGAF